MRKIARGNPSVPLCACCNAKVGSVLSSPATWLWLAVRCRVGQSHAAAGHSDGSVGALSQTG